MLRAVRLHIALILATPYLIAGCCVPRPYSVEGTWELQRTASPPVPGCEPLTADTFELTVLADGDAHVVMVEPTVEVREVSVADDRVEYVSSELPFTDSRSLVLIHELTLDHDGVLRGTARGQGDGDQIHCRYAVTLEGYQVD